MMHPKRKQKLLLALLMLTLISVAVLLITYALRQNISLFYSPTQLKEASISPKQSIRVGGMVVKGSVVHSAKDLSVEFKLTDYANTMTVRYTGILPDLFREGQGIVAQGKLIAPELVLASEVLAKHDENYMPKEIRDTLIK